MKGNTPFFAVKRYDCFKAVVLLCLFYSLGMSACGSTLPPPTQTIAIPTPIISTPNGRCELAPGESLQLAVTGVAGDNIVYNWIAGAGNVTPSDGLVVMYTAPDTRGNDTVRVEARKDGQSSVGEIKCVVSTPVPFPPTESPLACLTDDDILVEFQILRNTNEITTLSHLENITLEPGMDYAFEVSISSARDELLPEFDYVWKNTGVDSGGELLDSADHMVDYRSKYNDAISLQISQPDCNALAPYSFSILSKLKVDHEIVPCYKEERKILVNLYPTGGTGVYNYHKAQVFDVQIGDNITLVVTSGIQTWAESIQISRDLMRNCISLFKSDDGGGDPDGGSEDPIE
jgi:hypothetical protein